MKKRHQTMKLTNQALLVFALVALAVETNAQESSKENKQADMLHVESLQFNSTTARANETMIERTKVSERSMAPQARQSSRAGRMLDLDHLTGEIGKDEKMAREKSMSGQRQSRILSEDINLAESGQPSENRARKLKSGKKKMSIQGFIPIVSLEGGKGGKHLDGSDENDPGEEEDEEESHATSNTRQRIASNFGDQTSIGHASFAPQSSQSEQLQVYGQQQQQQQQQPTIIQEAGRANRKLLGGGGLLGNLANQQKKLVSTLISPGFGQQQPILHRPMNEPLMMNQMQAEDCICVPFFQCKGGYLSVSQLSKSQMHQAISGSHNYPLLNADVQPYQVPRAINLDGSSQQQTNDLYYAKQLQQHQISGQVSQLNAQRQQAQGFDQNQGGDQQMVNDIYEQLRKSIESENLEQQAAGYNMALDERSKSGSSGSSGDANVVTSNNTSNSQHEGEEVSGRSFLNPLGRRSEGNQQRCGIMRTCCKIPPTLHQLPQLNHHFNQHGARLVGPQLTSVMRPQHQPPLPLQNQPQPQYNILRPSRFGNQQPQSMPHLDYQQSGSVPLGTSLQSLPGHSLVEQSMPVHRPTGGSFMAGRCGVRQTIGISGRVQNSQPSGGDSTAEFGEFPAHAAILKRLSPGDSLFVCSAVLISNQWLATAAHCIKKQRPDELKVRLGEWDVNRDDEFYPFVESNIREIVVHPEFQPTSLANDLALLRIDATMDPQQMPHIAPACLATAADEPQPGAAQQQRCWVAGWGKDAFGHVGTFQSVLKKVDLPVVGRQECETALRYQTKLGKFFRLHQSAICAGGERGKDACEGDGGAGLYCIDAETGLTKVLGLVSWGIGCGQRGVPGVYTNLATLQPWIENVIAASGEESLYLDRSGIPDGNFKNLVNERSNSATTATNSTSNI